VEHILNRIKHLCFFTFKMADHFNLIIAILLFTTVALADNANIPIGQVSVVNVDMVQYINQLQTTWKASTDQGSTISGLTREEAKRLMGVKSGGVQLPRISFPPRETALPATFDARTNWPQCPTISQIRDQSACGSCWAFGAVEAMSDRYCIFKINNNLSISVEDLNSCCRMCGRGCGGGYPAAAWQYWVKTGLVSEACDPYSLPSCDHHMPNSQNPCPSEDYSTPPCIQQCHNDENWNTALHFGKTAYTVSGVTNIMNEIYQNGPVEGAFIVYEDFLSYKSGVYQHVSGANLGGHAIKILGWGTMNGTDYWLCANSWNTNWGDHGFFRILKGRNECGIEDQASAGVPLN